MTTSQWERFEDLLISLVKDRGVQWHDGMCLGADEQAHHSMEHLIRDRVVPESLLVGHPCNLKKWQADLNYDLVRDELPPLVRNKKIVEQVYAMFAGPREYEEVKIGSGTWATIRYTRRKKRPLFIIWPDGTSEVENI